MVTKGKRNQGKTTNTRKSNTYKNLWNHSVRYQKFSVQMNKNFAKYMTISQFFQDIRLHFLLWFHVCVYATSTSFQLRFIFFKASAIIMFHALYGFLKLLSCTFASHTHSVSPSSSILTRCSMLFNLFSSNVC